MNYKIMCLNIDSDVNVALSLAWRSSIPMLFSVQFKCFWWVVRCKTIPLQSSLSSAVIQKHLQHYLAQEERLFSDVFWKVCPFEKFTFQNCGFSEQLASPGINYPHQRSTVRGLFQIRFFSICIKLSNFKIFHRIRYSAKA